MIASLIRDNLPFLRFLIVASIAFLAAALILERFAGRLSAASRHTIVFAALLVPPVFLAAAVWVPRPSIERSDAPAAIVVAEVAAAAPASKSFDAAALLGAIWLLGVVVSLVRSARNVLHWRSVARYADRKDGFAVSHECPEPMVIGIVRPMIVLPANDYIESLTEAELETVFAHERAHIARRDNLVALLAQLICSSFWFDPLHRIARRRLLALREQACDEAVLQRGGDPDSYLAALARTCEAPFRSSAVSCMSRLQLRERMEWIMTFDTHRRVSSPLVHVAIGIAIAIAAGAFAVLAPTPTLIASETAAGLVAETSDAEFDVVALRGPKMNTIVRIKRDSFMGVVEFESAPGVRTLTTTTADHRTYKWTIQLNSDGSGSTTMDVTEGDSVVATAVKTFAAPAYAPPAPPRPPVQRVDATMTPPKVISRVDPVYPAEAKQNRIAGVVILELTIEADGSVSDITVLKSLPYGLDQAAVDAVRQWRFEPAMKDGNPIRVQFNITINFKLDQSDAV